MHPRRTLHRHMRRRHTLHQAMPHQYTLLHPTVLLPHQLTLNQHMVLPHHHHMLLLHQAMHHRRTLQRHTLRHHHHHHRRRRWYHQFRWYRLYHRRFIWCSFRKSRVLAFTTSTITRKLTISTRFAPMCTTSRQWYSMVSRSGWKRRKASLPEDVCSTTTMTTSRPIWILIDFVVFVSFFCCVFIIAIQSSYQKEPSFKRGFLSYLLHFFVISLPIFYCYFM